MIYVFWVCISLMCRTGRRCLPTTWVSKTVQMSSFCYSKIMCFCIFSFHFSFLEQLMNRTNFELLNIIAIAASWSDFSYNLWESRLSYSVIISRETCTVTNMSAYFSNLKIWVLIIILTTLLLNFPFCFFLWSSIRPLWDYALSLLFICCEH